MTQTALMEKSVSQRVIENPVGYDGDVFLQKVLEYISENVSERYPDTCIKEQGDGISSEFYLYEIKKETVPRHSVWTGKFKGNVERVIEKSLAHTYYYDDGRRLDALVDDPEIVKACQNVAELAKGNIIVRI